MRDAICIMWSAHEPFENRIFKFQILSQLKFVNVYTTLGFMQALFFYSSEQWNIHKYDWITITNAPKNIYFHIIIIILNSQREKKNKFG